MKTHLLRVAAVLLISTATACAQGNGQPVSPPNANPTPAPARTQPAQKSNPNAPASSTASPNQAPGQAAESNDKEGHERIVFVVPAFLTTNNQNAPPLTPKQKFVLFARSSFDPFPFAVTGFEAGLSQWEDEFCGSNPPHATVKRNCPGEYGQGVAGYAKRYGASFADGVDSNFMSNFAWSSILKEDPRYFRINEGSFQHRALHSLLQEVHCRTDKATKTICWENILGAFSTGAISNVYYPAGERGIGLTMSRSSISIAYGAAGNFATEFWPDINRRLFHKKQKATTADGAK